MKDARQKEHILYNSLYIRLKTGKTNLWNLKQGQWLVTLEKINDWKGHKDANGLASVLFLNLGLITC